MTNATAAPTADPATGLSYLTTYHRDHTVTVWDVYAQQWVRTGRPSDAVLASFCDTERTRVMRHCGMIRRTIATARHIYRLHEISTSTGPRVVGCRVSGFSPDTSKRSLLRSIRGDFTTAPIGSYGYGLVDETGREVVSLNIR